MLRIPVNRCDSNWTARTAFRKLAFNGVNTVECAGRNTQYKLFDAFNSSCLQHNDDKNDETLIFNKIKSFINKVEK